MLLRDMRRALSSVLSCVLLLPAGWATAAETGTIVIQGAPTGETVQVDGAPIGQVPLPGPWTLSAGSHDVKIGDRSQTVTVPAGKEITVAYAAAAAPAPEKTAVAVATTADRFPVATAGYVGAGLGLAAIGAGVFFGLQSSDDPSEAERSAVFANICYGIGGVLIAGGAAMIVWGSDGPLSASLTPGGAVIGGRF